MYKYIHTMKSSAYPFSILVCSKTISPFPQIPEVSTVIRGNYILNKKHSYVKIKVKSLKYKYLSES